MESAEAQCRLDAVRRCHEKVWAFREKWGAVWKTPSRKESLEYAFTEAAEALDADIRARRPDDLRARVEPDNSVRKELAQCAVMVLSAMPDFPWDSVDFRRGLESEFVKPDIMDLGVHIRHSTMFIFTEQLCEDAPYSFTAVYLGTTLALLWQLLDGDMEAAIDDELAYRQEKIEYRQSLEYKYLQGEVQCPHCGYNQEVLVVDYDHFDVDGTGCWQPAKCGECGARWADSYSLTGVVWIDEPKSEDASSGLATLADVEPPMPSLEEILGL